MSADENTIVIRRPDDWHLHLRDGEMLRAVLPHTAKQFARAIVMPNLAPPVTLVEHAVAYRQRILEALPAGMRFEPLMTLYLTDDTRPETVREGKESGAVTAVKLYPQNATTNSAHGVTNIDKVMPTLEAMADVGLPLCVHGEVTSPDIDVYDREAVFIERTLGPLVDRIPELKVVLEHITTKDGVDFVKGARENVAGTITAHHLVINRNALFAGGLRPHAYCLPVAKREEHRLALRAAATSGNPRFFLGTDSAPHAIDAKEQDCGCAGIFSAPCALEVYAQVFDDENALDRLEAFASLNGPRFYELEPNTDTVTLERRPSPVADAIVVEGGERVRPFLAGEETRFTML